MVGGDGGGRWMRFFHIGKALPEHAQCVPGYGVKEPKDGGRRVRRVVQMVLKHAPS